MDSPSASSACRHSQAPLWQQGKHDVLNWDASNWYSHPLWRNLVDDVAFCWRLLTGRVSVYAAAAMLRGAALGDLGRAVLHLVLSRTAYITEERVSTGLVLCQHNSTILPNGKVSACEYKCRPVGLRALLSRWLQRTLRKVFKGSFIFFTAKREINTRTLKERIGNRSAASLHWIKRWKRTSERRQWWSWVLSRTRQWGHAHDRTWGSVYPGHW